jgi:hypothetical protein
MDGDDDDRQKRLWARAQALADPLAWRQARFHLLGIELLSRAVPEGVNILEAASSVHVVRRKVIVHRDLRAAMRRCILQNSWDFAVTRIPRGAKSDEFGTLWGWSWHSPELPGIRKPPSNRLIRDVNMLKGEHGLKGQDKRRATLTGERLNEEIIRLAVDEPDKPKRRVRVCELPPDFGIWWKRGTRPIPNPDDTDPPEVEPPAFASPPYKLKIPRLTGQSWIVGDHPDIAAPIKREKDKCDAIARALLDDTETERERIAGLNERHSAMLEGIAGKSTYVPPPTKSHPAADMGSQAAALDMVGFEETGFRIRERRDRHNDLLESEEKLNKRGKRYHPNKADPGRKLTGDALIAAIAELRPQKKGWPHTKPCPRGDETGLFEKCRRAGRKRPQDYTTPDDDESEMYRRWDEIGTPAATGHADRCRLPRPMDSAAYDTFADKHWATKRLINIPEIWSRNCFAEEVMSFRSKKPGWEWGQLSAGFRTRDYKDAGSLSSTNRN